ncbi:hypothetical protein pb186bvf_012092 [Paramecium bursaria]
MKSQKIVVNSPSLERTIRKMQLSKNSTSMIGIATIQTPQIPKQRSHYDLVKQCNSNRIGDPKDGPQFQKRLMESSKMQPREVTALKSYCKSQTILDQTQQKYFVRKNNQMAQMMQKCNFSVSQLVEKLNKKIVNSKNPAVKDEIKRQVLNQIPKKPTDPPYELDSLFKNYKQYSEFYQAENEFSLGPKKYNMLNKIYTQSQKEDIFITLKERDKTPSDESDAFQDYVDNLDPADVQRDVYGTNIRNPFLEDKATVRAMKLSGLLKRRRTHN